MDNYLPANSAPGTQQPSTPPVLPGTYKLDIGSLTISQRTFSEVGIDLGIGADEITLGRLDTTLFGASFVPLAHTSSHRRSLISAVQWMDYN